MFMEEKALGLQITIEERHKKMVEANDAVLKWDRKRKNRMSNKIFYPLSVALATFGSLFTYSCTGDPIAGAVGAYAGTLPLIKENVVDEAAFRIAKWRGDIRSEIYSFDEPLKDTHPVSHFLHNLFNIKNYPTTSITDGDISNLL